MIVISLSFSLLMYLFFRSYLIGFFTCQDLQRMNLLMPLFNVLEVHMKGYYTEWNRDEKLEEFIETDKYLLAYDSNSTSSSLVLENIFGFCGFRFLIEGVADVVYCYELHVMENYRKLQIGKELMNV